MKNWSRLFLAAVFVPAAMWAESLTPEKVLDRRGLSEVRWSPDGTKVAFVVAEPMRGADQNRDIWLYDETHDELRRLTTSDESDRSPRWSPDGRTLAFISDPAQIHLLPMSGGEARALTNGKTGVTRFVWSPDGSAIAFLAPEPRSEEDEKRNEDKDDARVVDKDDRPPQLWSVDVASGDVSALTTGINAYDTWFLGNPYENQAHFVERSPVTHVRNAKTPTLIPCGENDRTDPIGQCTQFYRGLRRYGVDAELVIYPREGNGIREEKHRLDLLRRVVAWFDARLRSGS